MNVKAVVGGIVILGALALGVFVMGNAGKNYYTVDQYLDLDSRPRRAVKVRGLVVADTLRSTGTSLDFALLDPETGTRRTLPVHYDLLVAQGQRPDALLPGADVVIEGHLGEGGVFQASSILAKCPSKYEKDEPGSGGDTGIGPNGSTP